MVKDRTTQVVFQTIYCVLAVIGFIASLGYFEKTFKGEFYIYYTNLSNYICMVFMFISLAKTIKSAKKEKEGYVDTYPCFKFLCVIMILVTCLVYNILLAKNHSIYEYFTSISNLTLHLILPIMFILDWVLFYKHGNVKWYYPLLASIMPLIYVVFILIRSAILGSNTTATLYPYFFLNIDKLGVGGFFGWVIALIAVFVLLGYIFYLCDNIKSIKQKFASKKLQTSANDNNVVNKDLTLEKDTLENTDNATSKDDDNKQENDKSENQKEAQSQSEATKSTKNTPKNTTKPSTKSNTANKKNYKKQTQEKLNQ